MVSDEQNWLTGSWIRAKPTWPPSGSVRFLTPESQKNRVPLHNWCREDGPSRVGLVLGSVLSLEKAQRLSSPLWETEGPTLEVPMRCSFPHTVRKKKINVISQGPL